VGGWLCVVAGGVPLFATAWLFFDLMDYRSFSKFSALDRSSKSAEDILKHFPFRPAAT